SDVQGKTYLPGLVDGSTIGSVALGGSVSWTGDGRLAGEAGLVLSGGLAQLVVVRVGNDLAIVPTSSLTMMPTESIDPTRRVVRVALDNVSVADGDVIAGG